ncbi:RT0821/Lpp0805 family surface protein [Labrys portucalensis]|uniref:RT0821/Lpp0805 family surface protein n=1 Tax=Labrys neptuniae TaxID=376174 RepID=A0ABV3PI52_9HYPH|nr:RT0821/Lpp0805 family surface protein [Labrys neptuniae]MDT3380916.1 RT0821/Lpp0805 family surface protein [Labrys neptuniae]
MFSLFVFKGAYNAYRVRGPLSALIASVILTGCAISTPLGPIFGSAEDQTTTGSIPAQDIRLNASMTDADWQQAKAALQAAMDPQNPGASIQWSNMTTGAHGSVTPVAETYVENKLTCRSFVAAQSDQTGGLVRGSNPAQWYQGKGCRKSGTAWSIVSVQPWALPRA